MMYESFYDVYVGTYVTFGHMYHTLGICSKLILACCTKELVVRALGRFIVG